MELPSEADLLDPDWLTRFQAEHGAAAFDQMLRRAADAYGGAVTAVAASLLPGWFPRWIDKVGIDVRRTLPHRLLASSWSPAPEGPGPHRQGARCLLSSKSDTSLAEMGQTPPPNLPLPNLLDLRLRHPFDFAVLAHSDGIWGCEVSPDGSVVASVSRDGDVALWNIESGRLSARATTGEPEVRDCIFTPDGQLLVSIHANGRVSIWQVPNLRAVDTFEAPFEPPANVDLSAVSPRRWRRLAVSPDSAWLAVGRWNSIEVWDLVRRRPASTLVLDSEEPTGAFALTFISERQLCVVGHSDLAPFENWDVLDKQVISTGRLKRRTRACIGHCTPDAQYLVTASEDLEVYRLEDSHLVASARVNMVGRALAVSADGTRAATFGGEPWSTLRVWSLPNLTEVARWNLLELGCWDVSCALAFTPDAANVIAAGWDGVLRRIRIPNGRGGSACE